MAADSYFSKVKDFFAGAGKKGFWTGHDLAVDPTRAAQVVSDVQSIVSKVVVPARDNVENAIEELNKVAANAGTVSVDGINSLFEEIGNAIGGIGSKLQEAADIAQAYSSNKSILKTIFSTATMGVVSAAEGLLSPVEELGDAIVGIVGWTFGNDKFKRGCENFIKSNWSHDMFNFYYKSDFAKVSAFTEDSAIAGALRITGKATTYTLAEPIAGRAGLGLFGLGSGIEAGLRAGKTLDKGGGAMKQGIIQGGIGALIGQPIASAIINNSAESGNPLYPGATMKGIIMPSVSNKVKVTAGSSGNNPPSSRVPTPPSTTSPDDPPSADPPKDPGGSDPPKDKKPGDSSSKGGGGNNGGGNNGGGNNSHGGGNNGSNQNPSTTPPTETPKNTTTPKQTDQKDPIKTVTPSDDNKSVTPPSDSTPVEPTPPENVTPPSQPPVTEQTNESPVYHSGGGYSETEGYTPSEDSITEISPAENLEENTMEELMDETTTSVDDIIRGNKYTKIPTSTTPIKKNPKSSGSTIIPIAAGLSAAAAAGIGAKAYIDRKNNSDNGDEDDFEDDWSENDSANLDYTDNTSDNEDSTYLTNDDSYEGEKYDAKNNEELDDLQ